MTEEDLGDTPPSPFQSWHALVGIGVAGGMSGMDDDQFRTLCTLAKNEIREDERRCLAFLLRAVLIGDVVSDAMAAIRVLIDLAVALEDGQVVTIDKLREWAK